MSAMVVQLIAYAIVFIFVTCAAIPLLNLVLGTLDSWIGYAFFIEAAFDDVSNYFDLEGVCQAIYSFAIAFLVLCFITRLIKVYFSWSGGDPETSPMTVLIGFLKALIVMVAFGTCYEYFANIIYNMFQALIKYGFLGGIDTSELIDLDSFQDLAFSAFGAVMMFIVALNLFLVYIGVLTRGIQMLILRLGIAFAAIGLLNADGGVFKNYIKKFLQTGFTVLVQIFLSYLSVVLLSGQHYILALITASTAVKGASMLQEFLGGGTGAFGEQGLTSAMGTLNQASMLTSRAVKAGASIATPAAAGIASLPSAAKSAGQTFAGTQTGKNISSGANKVKGKVGEGVSAVGGKISNSKVGSTIGKGAKAVGSAASNVGQDIKNSKVGSAAISVGRGVGKTAGDVGKGVSSFGQNFASEYTKKMQAVEKSKKGNYKEGG